MPPKKIAWQIVNKHSEQRANRGQRAECSRTENAVDAELRQESHFERTAAKPKRLKKTTTKKTVPAFEPLGHALTASESFHQHVHLKRSQTQTPQMTQRGDQTGTEALGVAD